MTSRQASASTPVPSPQGEGGPAAIGAPSALQPLHGPLAIERSVWLDAPLPVLELLSVDSTNADAMRRAAAGERGPMWIMAHRQTAGRGRAGRAWVSPDGNLAATLLLAPGCTPAALHQLSLLTGVAAYDALTGLVPADSTEAALRVKWPNDILAGPAKLGGILIESTISGTTAVAAIGIGINIAASPAIEGRATTCLAQLACTPSPTPRALLAALDGHLRRWLAAWQHGARFDLVRAAWLERAGPPGEAITIHTGAQTLWGTYAGIDETGALLVASVTPDQKEVRRFTFGDVSLSPPAAARGDCGA